MSTYSVSVLLLLLVTLALSQTVSADEELKTLMQIKASLDPESRYLSSWIESNNHCSFEGVACNEEGKVTNISLQGRGLAGTISPAISGLKSLTGLYLHYNSLTGEIPREISNLTELVDLYLNINNLSGTVPSQIGNLASLQVLQLCYNQLSGSIPTQLGMLKKLSVLALQYNLFTGAIPASLGDLSMLVRLDVSFNQLFGPIPGKLAEIPQLGVLDVRNNTLTGNVPPALKRLNKGFQYGNNTNLCGVGFSLLSACKSSDIMNLHKPEPFGPDSNGVHSKDIPESANVQLRCDKSTCSNSSKTPAIAVTIGVVAVVAGGIVAGLLSFIWYRRRKQKIGGTFEPSDSRMSTDMAKEYSRKSNSPLINLEYSNGWDPLSGGGFTNEVLQGFRFNLEVVETATQYFSEVNLLGKSSFAATYKGILRDGSLVAVKSINKTSCKTEELEFLKGLKILTSIQHENLVSLKGFCCSKGRGECFLIYDFVSNGSLLKFLDVKDGYERVLSWSKRVSIIKGIAKGIEYLHTVRPHKPALVHQNISAEKVLIDQHFRPLLSDSGLQKLLADDVVFSTLKSSAAMGYLAPEYTTVGRFTDKSDIYAFGVIILQVLSGKTRISYAMRIAAKSGKLEGFIDENLDGKFSESEAMKLARIASICTNEAPEFRPKMEMVAEDLIKCGETC